MSREVRGFLEKRGDCWRSEGISGETRGFLWRGEGIFSGRKRGVATVGFRTAH